MLRRALQRVQGGFYIDVGANDPVKDSVTKAFYDRGWHGINAEPVAAHHQDLERDRPLDINLRCALGDSDGVIDLWECELPGLATTDVSVVDQHIIAGHHGAYHRVPVRTLASVCAEHAPAEIHFLKIDVEGGEESVLAGADFRRFRPWIVVVEATRPNSTEQNHGAWEHLLTDAGYRFAYADGLNRFYVADEHKELAQALAFPPNIFDGFVVAQQFNLEQQAGQLQATIERLDQQLREAGERAARAEAQALEAGGRAARAEAQALKAGESAAQANERALQFSERATNAEARSQEFVARAARAEALAGEHQAAAQAAAERASQLMEMAHSAQLMAQQLQGRVALGEAMAQQLQERLVTTQTQLQQQLDEARRYIQEIFASRSWRLSKPVRWVGSWVRGERGRDRAAASVAAVQTDRPLAALPAAPGSTVGATHPEGRSPEAPPPVADELEQLDIVQPLPPRARHIYREIKSAVDSAKGKH